MTITDTPTPLNRLGRVMVERPLLPLIGLLILLVAVLAILNPGVLSMFWVGNTIKIAIPLGGIVTPLLIAAITSRASFGAALLVIPLGLLVGLLMIVLVLDRSDLQLLPEAA